MPQDDQGKLRELVLDFFNGEIPVFKPCAYYNPSLDSLHVVTRDCSLCEVRMNNLFHLLEDNHPEPHQSKHVGFMIWPVKRFCKQYGLPTAPASAHQILRKLLKEYPELSESIKIARRSLRKVEKKEVYLR